MLQGLVAEGPWRSTNVDVLTGRKAPRLLEPGKMWAASEKSQAPLTTLVKWVANGPEPEEKHVDQPA